MSYLLLLFIRIFLLRLPPTVARGEWGEFIEQYKIKLDNELNEAILRTFVNKDEEFDLSKLIDQYMKLYPDTALPPKKKKKNKAAKKKPKKAASETTTEQTEYTDYTYMSSAILSEETEPRYLEEGEEDTTEGVFPTVTSIRPEKIADPDDQTIDSDLFKSVLEGADQSGTTTLE